MGLPGVGFIGLGNMGLPMARNLLKAGRRLVVHDLNPAVAAPLTAAGATFASSPAEVASAVTGEGGAVFTMLHSGAAVREVYTGADGLLSACKPQTLLVDCSTVEPATAREMSSAAAAHGCDFLDAPVSGGAPGAASASLTFMVGSDSDAAFAAATPFFTQMGKPPVRCGSVGAGLAVKLANNLALSLQMLATAEAFSLGKAQGVDPHVLAQARCAEMRRDGDAPRFAETRRDQLRGSQVRCLTSPRRVPPAPPHRASHWARARLPRLLRRTAAPQPSHRRRRTRQVMNVSTARCWSSDTYNPVPGSAGAPAARLASAHSCRAENRCRASLRACRRRGITRAASQRRSCSRTSASPSTPPPPLARPRPPPSTPAASTDCRRSAVSRRATLARSTPSSRRRAASPTPSRWRWPRRGPRRRPPPQASPSTLAPHLADEPARQRSRISPGAAANRRVWRGGGSGRGRDDGSRHRDDGQDRPGRQGCRTLGVTRGVFTFSGEISVAIVTPRTRRRPLRLRSHTSHTRLVLPFCVTHLNHNKLVLRSASPAPGHRSYKIRACGGRPLTPVTCHLLSETLATGHTNHNHKRVNEDEKKVLSGRCHRIHEFE